MSFIQADDFDTFRQLLGEGEVPERYLREYSLRLTMFHKCCNSGPLGSLGIIDLLRFCGFKPALPLPKEEEANWDEVKRGTRVEALFTGQWMPGEYLGYGENRVLLVRLNDDSYVRECRRHMTRVAADQTPPAVEPTIEEPLPPAQLEPEDIPSGYQDPKSEVPPPSWEPKEATDWTHVAKGEAVWVDLPEDVQDGTFVSAANDGKLIVLVNGQEHTVSSVQVTLAAVA